MENEILKGNKLIAAFVGTTIYPIKGDKDFKKWKGERRDYYADELEYHSSWDWLMPVVEKIKDFDNQCDFKTAKLLQFFKDDECVNIFHTSIFCHLEEVYNRVIVFIKWYNKFNLQS